jgi:hypothetical protein
LSDAQLVKGSNDVYFCVEPGLSQAILGYFDQGYGVLISNHDSVELSVVHTLTHITIGFLDKQD